MLCKTNKFIATNFQEKTLNCYLIDVIEKNSVFNVCEQYICRGNVISLASIELKFR